MICFGANSDSIAAPSPERLLASDLRAPARAPAPPARQQQQPERDRSDQPSPDDDLNVDDWIRVGCEMLGGLDGVDLPSEQDNPETLDAFADFIKFVKTVDLNGTFERRPRRSGVKQDVLHGAKRLKSGGRKNPLDRHYSRAVCDGLRVMNPEDVDAVMRVLEAKFGGFDAAAAEFERRCRKSRDRYIQKRVRVKYLNAHEQFKAELCVFLTFGWMRSEAGMPYFDAEDWADAKRFLDDCLHGVYADDWDAAVYYLEDGVDSDGLMTYRTIRSESSTESTFLQDWRGLDCFTVSPRRLESEKAWQYNCYNRKAKERLGIIPVQGHGYNWIVYETQVMMRRSRGRVQFPDLVIPDDYESIGEPFGIVPSPLARETTAHEAAAKSLLSDGLKLSANNVYIARRMAVTIPFLNFSTKEEIRLLRKLEVNYSTTDAEKLCAIWNSVDASTGKFRFIDGRSVFPKIPSFIEQRLKRTANSAEMVAVYAKYKGIIDKLRQRILSMQSASASSEIPFQAAANASEIFAAPRAGRVREDAVPQGSTVEEQPAARQCWHSRPRRPRRCRGNARMVDGIEMACGRTAPDCPSADNPNLPCSTPLDEQVPWKRRQRLPRPSAATHAARGSTVRYRALAVFYAERPQHSRLCRANRIKLILQKSSSLQRYHLLCLVLLLLRSESRLSCGLPPPKWLSILLLRAVFLPVSANLLAVAAVQ